MNPPDKSTRLSHVGADGAARMVDVSAKAATVRSATAQAVVRMEPDTATAIAEARLAKGDVLAVARLAGIMAAKRTADLIPLCHPLPLDHVAVEITMGSDRATIRATAQTTGRTGVEMEALTAASVAALTLYDMAKAIDRAMTIDGVCLLEKHGGKSGSWVRPASP
ncbi:MAG: cyclic pyranopterin monophosphate synthase MoaC [Myxococcota bacterium]